MLNPILNDLDFAISKLDEMKYIILRCINENPGIRYREILKLTRYE